MVWVVWVVVEEVLYIYIYECISTPLPPVVWVVWVVVGGGGGRNYIYMYINVYNGMNGYF